MFPPNFAADKLALLRDGMIESIQIAILATLSASCCRCRSACSPRAT